MVFGKQLCLRWMVVAAVVASAGLPRVRAQEAAPPQYSGWVHIVVDEKTSYDYEIATGAMTQQWRSSAGMEVEYVLPKLLEQYQYSPVTQTIYRGSMNPLEAMLDLERVQETPVTVDAMLAILRQSLGADAVEVKEEEDRGMMRYTIKAPPAKANLKLGVFGNGTRTPTELWAETASKRVREVQFENRKMQVSYDRPVNSVYDAGAPRGATLVDNRASADTWAVYNRIQARIAKPFSDGVLARVRADRQNGKMVDYSIEVVGRKGAEWSVRGFPILGDEARDGAIRLPEEWAGAGSEELFHRLAITAPREESGGDGKIMWSHDLDPVTGAWGYTDTAFTQNPDGTFARSATRHDGRREMSGQTAVQMERDYLLVSGMYPSEATTGILRPTSHLELHTSPDRPGLVALRARSEPMTPGTVISDEWIDPAHDDRPVVFVMEFHNKAGAIIALQVIEFGEYATLPAPDGRSYPTTIATTHYAADASGNLVKSELEEKMTYHFFAGRTLPPLPDNKGRP